MAAGFELMFTTSFRMNIIEVVAGQNIENIDTRPFEIDVKHHESLFGITSAHFTSSDN